jgi:hypothetical protein
MNPCGRPRRCRPLDRQVVQGVRACQSMAPVGHSVAGAVLRAARNSAGISRATLAAMIGITGDAISVWERRPGQLASAPPSDVRRLQAALSGAGASRQMIADIEIAACCDLVVQAISRGESNTSSTGDTVPLATAFAELLIWAVIGRTPTRYRSAQDRHEDEQDD